jgi:tetratricopeptide (TPR) repeat protein
MYLRAIGDYEESADEVRIAVQLDPLSLPYRNALAQSLALIGLTDEAREAAEHVIAKDPHFRAAVETLGWCYVLEGDYENAATAFERLPTLAGSEYAGAAPRGYAYAKLGRTEDVQRMRTLLERRSRAHPEVMLDVDFAVIHEGLGERAEAMELLGKAVDSRLGSMIFVHAFAPWQEARPDPRFHAVLERIGVPQAAAV